MASVANSRVDKDKNNRRLRQRSCLRNSEVSLWTRVEIVDDPRKLI